MKTIYKIHIKGTERYFSNNASVPIGVDVYSAKRFWKKEHAEANIKTFEKTMRINKCSEFEKSIYSVGNKYELFLKMNPDFALEIVEEEVYDYYFLITFSHNDRTFFFKNLFDGDLEITLEKTKAMGMHNYSDVKEYSKLIHSSGYFTNAQTEIELVSF